MKYLLLVAMAAMCTSCSSENRDKKIKEAIIRDYGRGLDKNKLQRIDSVALARVDSLTDKTRISLKIESTEWWIEALNALIEINLQQGTEGRVTIDTFLARGMEYENDLEKSKQMIDSLKQAYEQADGNKVNGLYVKSIVFYSTMKHPGVDTLWATLTTDYRLEDTSQTLLSKLQTDKDFEEVSQRMQR